MHSIPLYNETEILRQLAAGEEDAFAKIYQQYHAKVYVIALRILKSVPQAEDVLQEVFIKLWNHRAKLTDVSDFSAYLNAITRNHIFNLLRKKAHEEVFLKEQQTSTQPSSNQTINDVLYHELDKQLHEAVSHLPPQQKRIFQLSRMHGLKQEEIADSLKISIGTVKKHMMVSLKFIRNYLASAHHLFLLIALFIKKY